MTLLDQVKEIIAEEVGLPVARLTETSHFSEDLEMDSLDKIEIVMALEKEFEIDMPDEDLAPLNTVGAMVDYLESRKVEATR